MIIKNRVKVRISSKVTRCFPYFCKMGVLLALGGGGDFGKGYFSPRVPILVHGTGVIVTSPFTCIAALASGVLLIRN